MFTAKATSLLATTRAVAKQRRIALVAVTLISVMLLVASGPAGAEGPARNETIAEYEIQFLKDMAAHHHHAVMMTTDIMMAGMSMCLERQDIRQELRDLCEDIVVLQNQEIMMMMSWLEEWYGITLTMDDLMAHMDENPDMMRMLEEMSMMESDEFQRVYIEEMIVHHSAALQPARQCKGKAEHSELKELCRDILEVQVAEIELMRQWLCEWYGECNFHIDPHERRAMHG